MSEWGVENWALFISIISAVFTGLGWLLSLKRHDQDISRERGAIVREYKERIEKVDDKLRQAVASGSRDDYTQMTLSMDLLRDAISLNFGWKVVPIKTAYGAYRRFVQNEDLVGIGLLSWVNQGYQQELETLRSKLIAEVSYQLEYSNVIERIREGAPPPDL